MNRAEALGLGGDAGRVGLVDGVQRGESGREAASGPRPPGPGTATPGARPCCAWSSPSRSSLWSPVSALNAASGMPPLRTSRSNTPISASPQRTRWSRNEAARRRLALQPQRHLAQVDRQRVAVDGVEAVPHDIAHRPPVGDRRGLGLARAHDRQLAAEPPRCRQQEVPRAGRRVADPDRKDRPLLVLGGRRRRQPLREHRLQRRLDQLGDQRLAACNSCRCSCARCR